MLHESDREDPLGVVRGMIWGVCLGGLLWLTMLAAVWYWWL